LKNVPYCSSLRTKPSHHPALSDLKEIVQKAHESTTHYLLLALKIPTKILKKLAAFIAETNQS
jgi:hypothetical protein